MFQTETMTVAATALILAHQGGWDEMLMVAAPLVVVGGLLVMANRRAKAHLRAHAHDAAAAEHGASDAGNGDADC